MKSLVVFYSRTGNTSLVASKIAALLNAETERILSRQAYDGPFGFAKAAFHSLTDRDVAIDPTKLTPDSYDLVVVAGPIWAGRIAPPVRTFLRRFRGHFKHAAFCVTHGGSAAATSFHQMETACEIRPLATLAVKAGDIAAGQYDLPVRTFVSTIENELGQDIRRMG
ncbi:MAG TPA: hypothetical protein VH858_08035 [Hyphomicrobiales bacterium]|jgi:menaquinone-dependent protoporphyrinogen IX oxidase